MARPDPDAKFDSPKDMAMDKKMGIKEDSPKDRAMDRKAVKKSPFPFRKM